MKKELPQLNNSEPNFLLIKCEALKYIKKGDAIFNKMFIERIDECITTLKALLAIDSEIPLIHTKIGALLLIKGAHFENNTFIQEGLGHYSMGGHIFNQYFGKN